MAAPHPTGLGFFQHLKYINGHIISILCKTIFPSAINGVHQALWSESFSAN
jgi:hypothetical protein